MNILFSFFLREKRISIAHQLYEKPIVLDKNAPKPDRREFSTAKMSRDVPAVENFTLFLTSNGFFPFGCSWQKKKKKKKKEDNQPNQSAE